MKNVCASVLFSGLMMVSGAVYGTEQSRAQLEKEYERDQAEVEKLKSQNPAVYFKLVENRNQKRMENYKNIRATARWGRINAQNPPECKYYSTEGVCVFPFTFISPYPKIAHVNTVTELMFPPKIGSWTAQGIQVYDAGKAGYSIRYYDPERSCHVDIFIYDRPFDMKSELAVLNDEIIAVAKEIYQSYENAKFDKSVSSGKFADSSELYVSFFGQYRSRKNGVNYDTFALVFLRNQKFVKIRISQEGMNRPAFEKTVRDFMAAFDKEVLLYSKRNNKTFTDDTPTYPIIYTFQRQ